MVNVILCYGELVECQGNITSVKYVSILQEGLLGRVWIGKPSNQEFDINRLQPTVKHGEYSETWCYTMLWGAVWSWWSARETSLLLNVSILQEGLLGRVWIGRPNNQEFDINRLQPTVKHGECYGVLFGAGGVPGKHHFC